MSWSLVGVKGLAHYLVNRIRRIVNFELDKEIEKDVF